MTAPTPEQMRAFADENEDWVGYTSPRVDRILNLSADALRAAADQLEAAKRLIRELTDPVACRYYNGGCQVHGYLWLKQGELCPHDEAHRDWFTTEHHSLDGREGREADAL